MANLTDDELFNLLFNGGKFSLPYLLKFSHKDLNSIYLVNDKQNIEFDGKLYQAAAFDYTPPDNTGNSGRLSASDIDTDLYNFIENADHNYTLEVIGAITENGQVQRLKLYKHFYGSVNYNAIERKLDFSLGKDDRLDMTFNPYSYDTDNNRGNA